MNLTPIDHVLFLPARKQDFGKNEGPVVRRVNSDFTELLNIIFDETTSMNDMDAIVLGFVGKYIPINHITKPQAVRGRSWDKHAVRKGARYTPTLYCRTTFVVPLSGPSR